MTSASSAAGGSKGGVGTSSSLSAPAGTVPFRSNCSVINWDSSEATTARKDKRRHFKLDGTLSSVSKHASLYVREAAADGLGNLGYGDASAASPALDSARVTTTQTHESNHTVTRMHTHGHTHARKSRTICAIILLVPLRRIACDSAGVYRF